MRLVSPSHTSSNRRYRTCTRDRNAMSFANVFSARYDGRCGIVDARPLHTEVLLRRLSGCRRRRRRPSIASDLSTGTDCTRIGFDLTRLGEGNRPGYMSGFLAVFPTVRRSNTAAGPARNPSRLRPWRWYRARWRWPPHGCTRTLRSLVSVVVEKKQRERRTTI